MGTVLKSKQKPMSMVTQAQPTLGHRVSLGELQAKPPGVSWEAASLSGLFHPVQQQGREHHLPGYGRVLCTWQAHPPPCPGATWEAWAGHGLQLWGPGVISEGQRGLHT